MIINDNKQLKFNVQENLFIKSLDISGTYHTTNGKRDNAKVLFDSANVIINKATVSGTIYNAFEQNGSASKYPVKSFKASNIVADDTSIKHNIFNIYKFADDAEVVISDSSFNLDVACSNVMRVSNIGDAKNVTITFKNIDWTYENKDSKDTEDAVWAGLLLFQPWPAASDAAFRSVDLSSAKTWKFVFDNCRYNGKKVTANNFGSISQLLIGYTFGQGDDVDDLYEILGSDNITVK